MCVSVWFLRQDVKARCHHTFPTTHHQTVYSGDRLPIVCRDVVGLCSHAFSLGKYDGHSIVVRGVHAVPDILRSPEQAPPTSGGVPPGVRKVLRRRCPRFSVYLLLDVNMSGYWKISSWTWVWTRAWIWLRAWDMGSGLGLHGCLSS